LARWCVRIAGVRSTLIVEEEVNAHVEGDRVGVMELRTPRIGDSENFVTLAFGT